MNIEIESKFEIEKNNAADFLEFLLSADKIAGYETGKDVKKYIYDNYYDTVNYTLLGNKASLRTRRSGSKQLVTLKISDQINKQISHSVFKRIEIEGEPDNDLFNEIRAKLLETGITVKDVPGLLSGLSSFEELVKNWDMQKTIEIFNTRIIRNVFISQDSFVEVTFDKVLCSSNKMQAGFYEIELESKNAEEQYISEIVKFLQERFPSILVPGNISKYEKSLKLLRL